MLAFTVWFPRYGRDDNYISQLCKSRTTRKCFGGHSERETPGPIPNPEAKPLSVDGTARGTLWESRSPPDIIYKSTCSSHYLRVERVLFFYSHTLKVHRSRHLYQQINLQNATFPIPLTTLYKATGVSNWSEQLE